ncbi:uncharacterized protein LOC134826905 [Culicoides brevitarsis]|uniref:uncharacterized protein LOC134826905 n=1 Tax=Culicoides brevitarsis TaxID=469753 RepID=UPI00307C6B76
MAPINSQPLNSEKNSIPIAESSKAISKTTETKSMILCDKKEILDFLDSISSQIKQINAHPEVVLKKNEETQTEIATKDAETQAEEPISVQETKQTSSANDSVAASSPIIPNPKLRTNRLLRSHPGMIQEFVNWYENESNLRNGGSFGQVRPKLVEIHARTCKVIENCTFVSSPSLLNWWNDFHQKYHIQFAEKERKALIANFDRVIDYFQRTNYIEAYQFMVQERQKLG